MHYIPMNNVAKVALNKNTLKALQFLIPIQLPTQKQWWSNPSTQWLHYLPIGLRMKLQCDAFEGLIILQVVQYLSV
jgi:hypothetical protein